MSRVPGDMPPDEHLRAALRHAPDAQLQAPHDVSAQILAAAHRAAAEKPPAPAPARRPWWAFGSPRRLGASGAFATVLLAGVLGLLWRGQQPGPQTEAANEAAAPLAEAMPAAAPAAPAAQPAEPAPVPAPAPVVTPPAPPKKAIETRAVQHPAPQAAPAAPAERGRADQALQQEQRKQTQDAMDNAARRTADEAKERATSRLAEADAAPPPPARQEAAAAGLARPAPPPPSPPPATHAPVTLGRAAAMAPPLMARPRPTAPWMDALAAGAAVQWTVDGEARAPTSSWLYALAEQTQGRWRAVDGAPAGTDYSVLQWQRGNEPPGRLWLGDERVRWCDAQGRCEEALLDAGVGPVLRKGLAR